MKILLLLLSLLLIIACGDKSQTGESAQSTQTSAQITSNEAAETTETSEQATIEYVFEPYVLKPKDESKKSPELRKVLNELLQIIENKNVEGLKPYVDANIHVSFGGENGWDDFVTFWELDQNPEKSMLWQELKNAITLGGTFDDENLNFYSTPYLHTIFPMDYEAFEYMAITGENVNIRDKPNTKGKLVAQLSYDIVRYVFNEGDVSISQTIGDQTHDWIRIEMADGKQGWVWGKFCRSSIDYRAGFAKVRDEGWKMTFFVAGD